MTFIHKQTEVYINKRLNNSIGLDRGGSMKIKAVKLTKLLICECFTPQKFERIYTVMHGYTYACMSIYPTTVIV